MSNIGRDTRPERKKDKAAPTSQGYLSPRSLLIQYLGVCVSERRRSRLSLSFSFTSPFKKKRNWWWIFESLVEFDIVVVVVVTLSRRKVDPLRESDARI